MDELRRGASLLFLLLLCAWQACRAQWAIRTGENDSVNYLVLRTDTNRQTAISSLHESQWPLPYPVYQFQTGDVDGNGSVDALVGVVKSTRFFSQPARRLFVFKNYHGLIRPLWLGSKLGGILEDFRWMNGVLRSLERTTDGRFFVCEYTWNGFGFTFSRFVIEDVTREEAIPLME